jgi:hypothetical protein
MAEAQTCIRKMQEREFGGLNLLSNEFSGFAVFV